MGARVSRTDAGPTASEHTGRYLSGERPGSGWSQVLQLFCSTIRSISGFGLYICHFSFYNKKVNKSKEGLLSSHHPSSTVNRITRLFTQEMSLNIIPGPSVRRRLARRAILNRTQSHGTVLFLRGHPVSLVSPVSAGRPPVPFAVGQYRRVLCRDNATPESSPQASPRSMGKWSFMTLVPGDNKWSSLKERQP